MNIYSVYDSSFFNSEIYKDYIKEHPGSGSLRVRAYSANEALPIEGVKVEISTYYKSNLIVFFQGETDSSGLIDRISLPTTNNDSNNLEIPERTIYQVHVIYEKENLDKEYSVGMYDGICTVQNIAVQPSTLKVGTVSWQ